MGGSEMAWRRFAALRWRDGRVQLLNSAITDVISSLSFEARNS